MFCSLIFLVVLIFSHNGLQNPAFRKPTEDSGSYARIMKSLPEHKKIFAGSREVLNISKDSMDFPITLLLARDETSPGFTSGRYGRVVKSQVKMNDEAGARTEYIGAAKEKTEERRLLDSKYMIVILEDN